MELVVDQYFLFSSRSVVNWKKTQNTFHWNSKCCILNCEKWNFCFADRSFSCQPNFLFPHCLSCNGSFIITSVSLKEDPDTNWKFGHFMSTENLRGLFEPSVALCQNYGIMICGSTWSKFWVRDHHVVSELWNWKR